MRSMYRGGTDIDLLPQIAAGDAHQPYDVFLLHVQKLCDNPMKINKQNAIQLTSILHLSNLTKTLPSR